MAQNKKTRIEKSITKPVTILPGLFTFDYLERDEDLEKSILRFVYNDMLDTKGKERKTTKKIIEKPEK